MARNTTDIAAPADVVWAVLADPRQYDRFVVGTKRVRRFDPAWPEPGAALHHTVGVGPAILRDATRVIGADPPATLRLHAGLRPMAVSEIVFTVERTGGTGTRLTIEEHPAEGPARVVWNPLLHSLLWLRNQELLRRLRRIAEHRATTTAAATPRRPRGVAGAAAGT